MQTDHYKGEKLFHWRNENEEVDAFLRRPNALNSIILELQLDSTSINDAQNLSDGLFNKYPPLNSRFCTSSAVLKKDISECIILKIQDE